MISALERIVSQGSDDGGRFVDMHHKKPRPAGVDPSGVILYVDVVTIIHPRREVREFNWIAGGRNVQYFYRGIVPCVGIAAQVYQVAVVVYKDIVGVDAKRI